MDEMTKEKIKAIRDYLSEHGSVSIAKQCNKEYITYTFYSDREGKFITGQAKVRFTSKDLSEGTMRYKQTLIPTDEFFSTTIYTLLNRGYELKD